MTFKNLKFAGFVIFALLLSCHKSEQQPLVSGEGAALPFLTTQDQDIVTATGQKVLLRGVNLGGWLLWTGAVLDLPDYAEKRFRQYLLEQLDSVKVQQFFEGVLNNYITAVDFDSIKALGFNCVRIPFHHRYVVESGGTPLNKAIGWAKQAGLYVLLDFHAAPGGQNPDNHSDSEGRAYLWESPSYQEQFIHLWEILVRRYKDEPTIAGYELMNEPVVADDHKLRELYLKTIARIRQIDKKHIIFLNGNMNALDFKVFDRKFGDHVVLVFHSYSREQTLRDETVGYRAVSARWNTPLMCNEFDDFHETRYFERNNVHWLIWNYKSIAMPLYLPLYTLSDDHTWKRWIDSNNRKSKQDRMVVLSEVAEIVRESALAADTKDQLLAELANPNVNYKSLFLDAGRSSPEDTKVLRVIQKRMVDLLTENLMGQVVESLEQMNAEQITRLTSSLQTRYWMRRQYGSLRQISQ